VDGQLPGIYALTQSPSGEFGQPGLRHTGNRFRKKRYLCTVIKKEKDMTPTLAQMSAWFDEFNHIVFNNTLPKVKISFNNARRMLGQFYWGGGRGIGIKISLFWDRTEEQYRNCLLHEMCHLYCYNNGWIHEHHGDRWKGIAAYAYRKTGLNIQRCEDISGWTPSGKKNQARLDAVNEKNGAPSIIVDLGYDTYHFIVKMSKNTLLKNINISGNLMTAAKTYRVVISDDSKFSRFQTSRSIHRGYKYLPGEYEMTMKPILDKGIAVENIVELRRGEYDFLGIR
jgi:hypothetical protein